MTETINGTKVEVVEDTEHVLSVLKENYEQSITNLGVLSEILDPSKNPDGHIYIETLSQITDLGGFFMDEINSDHRFRDRMFIGSINYGDALQGKNAKLVIRHAESKKVGQIEVDFGVSEIPIIGYFDLENVLYGCSIAREKPPKNPDLQQKI